MKYRQGFVTNSSSTSFIIAIKGGIENLSNLIDTDRKWKKFIEDSIKLLLESSDEYDTGSYRPANNDSWVTEGKWKDEIENLKKNNFKIYEKRVSIHDEHIQDSLSNLDKIDGIIILKDND
jgi:hypothetical protein